MFCSSCGAPITPGAKFCASCGQPQAAAPAPPPQPPPMPPEAAAAEPPPGQSYSPPPYPQQGYAPVASHVPLGIAGHEFATWVDRAIGYIIDSLIVGGAMVLLYVAAGAVIGSLGFLGSSVGASGLENLAGGMCCLLGALFPIATLAVGIYNRVYLVSERGYSIGQGVMKLKVIDGYGNKLSFGTALLRLVVQLALSLVPFAGIVDLLWPLWDPQRQTLHDKAVGSFVVYNR